MSAPPPSTSSTPTRKRKLPACLGLGNGSSSAARVAPSAVAVSSIPPPPQQSATKKQKLTTTTSTSRAIKPSNSNNATSSYSRNVTAAASSSSAYTAAAPIAFTKTCRSSVVTTTAATAPQLQLRTFSLSLLNPRSLAPFRLLSLPDDLLGTLTSYCTLIDAFFLRCTCMSMRSVSGINGGVRGDDAILKKLNQEVMQTERDHDAPLDSFNDDDPSHNPNHSDFMSDDIDSSSLEETDTSHRFWHQWNSLDMRQILKGWKQFEVMKRKLVPSRDPLPSAARPPFSPSSVVDLRTESSPTPSISPVANTITIFESDDEEQPDVDADATQDVESVDSGDNDVEEDGTPVVIHMHEVKRKRRGNGVPEDRAAFQSTASPSPPPPTGDSLTTDPSSPYRIDIYQRLQHSLAASFQHSALSSSSSSPSASEDVSTTSEEDVWLLHFLTTHRFPFIQYLHFSYVTMHTSLLQHLQSYCCASDTSVSSLSSTSSKTGSVHEISLKYSEKSHGLGRWMEMIWKGFGQLEKLVLDLAASSRPFPSLPNSFAFAASSLTHLNLIGPTLPTTALPPSILDAIAHSLPELRCLTVVHGLTTTQTHVQQFVVNLKANPTRFARLKSLKLIHFPLIESVLSLFQVLQLRSQLVRIEIQECINLRLPNVEVPKKEAKTVAAAAASSSSKKKKSATNVRSDSPPRRALPVSSSSSSSRASSDDMLLRDAPRLPHLLSCSFSRCASLTATSLRTLSVLFPNLTDLKITDQYQNKMMSGSALKIVMDSSLFPSLTSLSLSNCPHINDGAFESLPKKTRMNQLRKLDLSISHRILAAATSNASGGSKTLTTKQQQRTLLESVPDGRFTEYALKMLIIYCPYLREFKLSGQSHLAPKVMHKIWSQLTLMKCVELKGVSSVDAAWLLEVSNAAVSRPLKLTISLSSALLRTSHLFLSQSNGVASSGAAAASSSSTSSVLPQPPLSSSSDTRPLLTKLLSTSVNGALRREQLKAALEQQMDRLSAHRIELHVL